MATDAGLDRPSPKKSSKALSALRLQRLQHVAGAMFARYLVLLLFAELYAAGGDQPFVSLALAALELLSLAALLLLAPWARMSLSRIRYLDLISLLFVSLLAWTAVQMIPLPFLHTPSGWAHAPGQARISIAPYATLTELLELAGLGAVFLMGLAVGCDDDRAHAAWNAFGVFGALYVGWVLTLHGMHLDITPLNDERLTGTLGNPNTTGCVLGMFATIAWTAILRAAASFRSDNMAPQRVNSLLLKAAPWGVLVVMCLSALSLTGSRGAAGATLLGMLISTMIIARSEQKRRRLYYGIITASVGIVLLFTLLVLSSGSVAGRLAVADTALANRQTILGIYFGQLSHAPWTGFGLGTFREFNNLLIGQGDRSVLWNLGALHNVFLQWIFEGGYPGAALMFATVALILVAVAQGLKRRRFGRTWIAGSLGVTAIVLGHGLIDFALQLPAIAGIWALMLGIGLGVSRPSSR